MTGENKTGTCYLTPEEPAGVWTRHIFTLLDREAELQERVGAIDMEERILRIPRLKAQAEMAYAMSPEARDQAIEDACARIEDHEQDIELQLETARYHALQEPR